MNRFEYTIFSVIIIAYRIENISFINVVSSHTLRFRCQPLVDPLSNIFEIEFHLHAKRETRAKKSKYLVFIPIEHSSRFYLVGTVHLVCEKEYEGVKKCGSNELVEKMLKQKGKHSADCVWFLFEFARQKYLTTLRRVLGMRMEIGFRFTIIQIKLFVSKWDQRRL